MVLEHDAVQVYVSYAHRWAVDGDAALEAMAKSRETTHLLDDLVKADAPGKGITELRRLPKTPHTSHTQNRTPHPSRHIPKRINLLPFP